MLVAINLAAQSSFTVTEGTTGKYQIDSQSTIASYQWEVYTDKTLTSPADSSDVVLTSLGTGRENEIEVTWNTTGTYYLVVSVTGTDGCVNTMAYIFNVAAGNQSVTFTASPFCSGEVPHFSWKIDTIGVTLSSVSLSVFDSEGNLIEEKENASLTGSEEWPGVYLSSDGLYDVPQNRETLVLEVVYTTVSSETDTLSAEITVPDCHTNTVVAVADTADIYGKETILNVLDNDYDPDEGEIDTTSLSIYITEDFNGPYHGEVTVNADGTISYTPDLGYAGLDSFMYRICDDYTETACDTAIVHLELFDRLVAFDDYYSIYTGQTGIFDVTSNDYDPEDSLNLSSIVIISDPENGNVMSNGDGTVTYQPLPAFEGIDSFEYVICNWKQQCDSAWVYVNMHQNECVVARWDDTITYVNQAVNISVLDNDYDYENELDTASLAIEDSSLHGSVTILDDSIITYVPDSLFAGIDSFIYKVCDDGYPQCCDTAVVHVTVIDNNIAIVANPDVAITLENEPVNIAILDNDFDEDGNIDTTSVSIVEGPRNGEVTVNSDGTILYLPDNSFIGTDSLIYRVCDDGPIVSCDTAVVYINVTENLPPVAVNDTVIAWVGTDTTYIVSINDYDPEGALDSASVTIIDSTGFGTVSVDPVTGIITYSPDSCIIAVDSFTYVIYDVLDNKSNVATVYINLIFDPSMDTDGDEVPDLAEDVDGDGSPCNDDTDGDGIPNYLDIDDDGDNVLTINEDVDGDGDPTNDDTDDDGTPNYLDPEDDDDCMLTIDEIEHSKGDYLFDLDGDGIPDYIDNDEDGDGILSCDENEDRDGNGILDRYEKWDAAAVDDEVTIKIDKTVDIPVLENDSTQMNDSTLTIIVDPVNGYADINEDDWTITYSPDDGFTGVDSFQYEVCDYYGYCDSAWVFIYIEDIEIPQLFTPNGDGDNDYFVISGLEKYADNHFVVYNRWGNKVYEKQGYANDWDGYANVRITMGEQKLPVGVYYYILNYGNDRQRAGALFLER